MAVGQGVKTVADAAQRARTDHEAGQQHGGVPPCLLACEVDGGEVAVEAQVGLEGVEAFGSVGEGFAVGGEGRPQSTEVADALAECKLGGGLPVRGAAGAAAGYDLPFAAVEGEAERCEASGQGWGFLSCFCHDNVLFLCSFYICWIYM